MPRNWAESVPRSSLGLRDVTQREWEDFQSFDCVGEDPTPSADEINEIVRHAQWVSWSGFCRGLQFGTHDAVVGYAVFEFVPFPFPRHDSGVEKPYLNLAVLGIQKEYQRRPDPDATCETFADVILRAVETLVAPTRSKVVGIYGISRVDNPRSIRLLRRNGYVEDESGPFKDATSGVESIILRKPRSSWRAS